MIYGVSTMIASVVAVVIVFLFAVEKFSHQMHVLVGEKFKNILQRSTNTPLKAAGVGFLVTSVFQSSTAVSVLLVSLVDAGLLSLAGGLGVVIGANIGTTITSQLVAFKILNIAPYILIIGFFLMKIKNQYHYLGKPIFYFGLIFSSLLIISVMAESASQSTFLLDLLAHTSNIFIAIGAGFLASNILQSSSLTTGIVVVLASQGIVDFNQAFGLILGTNIGTTTTALLASLVVGKQGKRIAVGHLVFNVVGVLMFIPITQTLGQLITQVPVTLATQVALSHLVFNVSIAIIFLSLFKYFEKFVHRLVP